MKKRINLGVVFYGHKAQLSVNREQFEHLKNELADFRLRHYDFNKGEYNALLSDFNKGKVDIVLKNSYGRGNESLVEAFLELNGIPYLGSNSAATFVGTSKILAKIFFTEHDLPVAESIYIDSFIWENKNKILSAIKQKIDFPCIIKDVAGTDSRGLSVVRNYAKIAGLLNEALGRASGVIVEKFIDTAYEATCFVVGGNKPFAFEPVGMGKGNIFSLQNKNKMSYHPELPANLSDKIIQAIKETSVQAHQILNCGSFSRADFLVKNNKLYLLEVDVHPGFRAKSPTTLSVKYAGQTLNELFLALCERLK